jgi:hypothetical protein
MAKSDYMPNDDSGKASLFILFRNGIGAHLADLGIPADDPDIVQQAADALRFRAMVAFCASMQQSAQYWTAEKNYERDGGGTAPTGQTMPVLPADFPPAVPAGIVARFRALVRRVKACRTYNTAMGLALGIEGSQPGGPDFATLRAILTLTLTGNAVLIGWGWQGFSFLTYDTTPDYTDTFPFPAVPTKWKYRAIYRVGDAQVGQWSHTGEITVGG